MIQIELDVVVLIVLFVIFQSLNFHQKYQLDNKKLYDVIFLFGGGSNYHLTFILLIHQNIMIIMIQLMHIIIH